MRKKKRQNNKNRWVAAPPALSASIDVVASRSQHARYSSFHHQLWMIITCFVLFFVFFFLFFCFLHVCLCFVFVFWLFFFFEAIRHSVNNVTGF